MLEDMEDEVVSNVAQFITPNGKYQSIQKATTDSLVVATFLFGQQHSQQRWNVGMDETKLEDEEVKPVA